jgi:hypothetical protein
MGFDMCAALPQIVTVFSSQRVDLSLLFMVCFMLSRDCWECWACAAHIAPGIGSLCYLVVAGI